MEESIEYGIRESRRAKRLRLAVYCDGSVVVTTPVGIKQQIIFNFILEKREWIFEKLNFFRSVEVKKVSIFSEEDYRVYKEQAKILATERVEFFKNRLNIKYNAINIKNQKTRWGSCSKKGNLNFNYKIIFLPREIRDYVIIHEICHLREFNHSKRFWSLIQKAMPNYLDIKKQLQKLDPNY